MKQKIVPLLILTVIFLAGCKKEPSPVEPQSNPDLSEKLSLNVIDTLATGSYILQWTSSKKATSYVLQEDIDPPFNNGSIIYLGKDTVYHVSGKKYGQTFYYRVRGNNSVGSGEWSDTKMVIVHLKPVPIISLAVNGSNIYAGTQGGVFLSTNEGTSWTPINSGMKNLSIQAIVVSGLRIIVGTNDGAYLSTNNGIGWSEEGLVGRYVSSLAFNSSTVLAGTDSGVYLSTDYGITWQAGGLANYGVSVAASDSCIFARAGTGVYLSRNNGTTWQAIGFTGQSIYCVGVRNSTLFVGDGWGIYLSSDNGTTWLHVYDALVQGYYVGVSCFAFSLLNMYAASEMGYVFLASNNGWSWQTPAGTPGISEIKCLSTDSSGFVFAGTAKGAFRSMDNGRNWTQINNGLQLIP